MLLVSSYEESDPSKRKSSAFGGAQIFYDGNFELFKEILGSDYYIIPANRFEMLLSPVTDDISASVLLERLKMLNGTKSKTLAWARLGNFILLYKDGKLSVAAEE